MVCEYSLSEVLADEAEHKVDAGAKCVERILFFVLLMARYGVQDEVLHLCDCGGGGVVIGFEVL